MFVEGLPNREAMKTFVQETGISTFPNIIEGGKRENIPAKDWAELGFCAIAYPWTLVTTKLNSIREALEGLKQSMTTSPPPQIELQMAIFVKLSACYVICVAYIYKIYMGTPRNIEDCINITDR